MAGTESDQELSGECVTTDLLADMLSSLAIRIGLMTPDEIMAMCNCLYANMSVTSLAGFQAMLWRLEAPIDDILKRRENEE